jgi:hypothetical protein
MPDADPPPFWQTKRLDQMSEAEWESLCDGCGRCCLHKLRDEGTGALAFTNVACRLLDLRTCRCDDYRNRRVRVADCVTLRADTLVGVDWLPPSCAYRRLAEGRDLPSWHPLITGDPSTVFAAGAAVVSGVISEDYAGDLEHHLVEWPGLDVPSGPRRSCS